MTSLWNCCFNCCKENKERENDEASERTRLLSDSAHNTSIQRVTDHYFGTSAEVSTPMSDEQAAKRKIFQEGAANMIDVTNPYQIDQHEYKERMNEYSRRLANSNLRSTPDKRTFIIDDIPDPQIYLSSTHMLSHKDYLLIKVTAKEFSESLKDIKVDYREAVVVPFQIPWQVE